MAGQNILQAHASVVVSSRVEATERMRRRLRELSDDRRFRQTKIAARLGIAQSAVNRYIHGATPITVSFLEAISEETGIPIAELVAPPGTIHQLNADEAALIRWLRGWPLSVTRALVAFLAPFADEPPQAKQTRNLHELWRRMPAKKREWFYSVGLLLMEGTLAPDLQARLLARLEADQSAYAADPEGRRDEDDDA